MDYLTSWTTAEKLLTSIRPCDIIEFNRITYSHFGFYIGNGVCVHVQAPDKTSLGSSSASGSSSRSSKSDRGTKVAALLKDIAGRDFVRVNNSEVIAFQLGANRRPECEAKQLAISGLPTDYNGNAILGGSINVTYFLVSSNNCEGWSTYWRYDHPYGWSIQAVNGVVHSTIGSVERLSDAVICCAGAVLMDDKAPVYKKTTAAVAVVPYIATKYSVNCVRNLTDFAAGGLMRMFR